MDFAYHCAFSTKVTIFKGEPRYGSFILRKMGGALHEMHRKPPDPLQVPTVRIGVQYRMRALDKTLVINVLGSPVSIV